MTNTKAQLLNSLKRASYGKSKLVLLGTSPPCIYNKDFEYCTSFSAPLIETPAQICFFFLFSVRY
jgi:hypothetical protein